MNKLKIVSLLIIYLLTAFNIYLTAWDIGHSTGYKHALADVYLNEIDPKKEFEKEIKK